MKSDSKKVVVTALVGNSLIAAAKLVVAFISGSTAMFAEGIHSLADTGNQALLLLGFKLAAKPADSFHPFGYGKDVYFWSLMVAVCMFVVGAVVSLYEGVEKILHPAPIVNAQWIYLVLLLAVVFESYPWLVAYRAVREAEKGVGLITALVNSKRAAVLVVFFEDSAALLGLLIALAGVTISQVADLPIFDGIASVIIGLLLGFVAFVVAYEMRSLLLGESVSQQNHQKILDSAGREKCVDRVGELLTMHLGPDDALVALNVTFHDGLDTDEIESAIDRIEADISGNVPVARLIFIEAESTDEVTRKSFSADSAKTKKTNDN